MYVCPTSDRFDYIGVYSTLFSFYETAKTPLPSPVISYTNIKGR